MLNKLKYYIEEFNNQESEEKMESNENPYDTNNSWVNLEKKIDDMNFGNDNYLPSNANKESPDDIL
ncbi:MAG: hypothetical protein SFT68_05605 [Rickettsiaceae bacterium]|nr:hypothetical protein [Rickettsiaceae bacterium]